MKVFAVGSSRNIGYYASLRLLQQGHTVFYLLRNAAVFDGDSDMQPFVTSGTARFIKGDALSEEDMRKAWTEVTSADDDDTPVDLLLFSVGGTPSFSITKGFVVAPPNLCTMALLNTLSTFPVSQNPQPRVIVITSHGVTKKSHAELPLALRPVYALISGPHNDKIGMEKLVHYSAGWKSEWTEKGPKEDILASGWEEKVGAPGWLKSVVILRPALLNDGDVKGKYRVAESLPGAYGVSRKDVAHFISGDLLTNWSQYDGKTLSIGY